MVRGTDWKGEKSYHFAGGLLFFKNPLVNGGDFSALERCGTDGETFLRAFHR